MGSQLDKPEQIDITPLAAPLDDYALHHCGYSFYIWQHLLRNEQLIEYSIDIQNNVRYKEELQHFFYRHRHHIFVNTIFFNKKGSGGKFGKYGVFYERVFTNLGRIKDIPFQDSLLFFYIGFKGFQLLYKRYGYFTIQQQMFHITKQNKVKIWHSKDITKHTPIPPAHRPQNPQQQMIKKIIRIIEQNSDNSNSKRDKYPIGKMLHEKGLRNFNQVIANFREICQKEKFVIPDRLSCLDVITKGEIGGILDQFGEVKYTTVNTDTQENTAEDSASNPFKVMSKKKNEQKMNKNNMYDTPAVQLTNFDQLTPTRNRQAKRHKGIQISYSLQKTPKKNNNNQSSFQVHQQIKDTSINVVGNYLGPQSPIKFLQNSQKNNTAINAVHQYNVHQTYFPTHIPQSTALNPYFPNQRIYVNNNIATNVNSHIIRNPNPAHPRVVYQNCGYLNRQSSFDTFQNRFRTSPEYRVVVHSASRPMSNLPPRPCPNFTVAQQSSTLTPNTKSRPLSPMIPNSTVLRSTLPSFRQIKQNENKEDYQIPQPQNTFTKYLANYTPKKSSFAPPTTQVPLIKKQEDKNKENQRPVQINGYNFRHRQTFMSNLSEFQKNDEVKPLADNADIKNRFQQFKKSFQYEKKYHSKDIENAKPEIYQNYTNKCLQTHQEQKKLNKNNRFFGGILNSETAKSYLVSQGEKKNNELNNKQSQWGSNNGVQIPTKTDISDNVSSFPKQRIGDEKYLRYESIVFSHHDPRQKTQMPAQQKKYQPDIDKQIWEDMIKARNKQKLKASQQ